MNQLDRCSFAVYAAALGFSVLLFSATLNRAGDALAQNDKPDPSQTSGDPAMGKFAGPPPMEEKSASPAPEAVIQKWPERAQAAAREMIDEYGRPTRVTDGELVWVGVGPWQKTVVSRDAKPHFVGRLEKDFVEQTIAYKVPKEKIDELKRFDPRLTVEAAAGRISARSESEAKNYLALNLADEIVTDKRSADDARRFYLKVEELSRSGKSSPYLNGFLFPVRSDIDKPLNERDMDYDRRMLP
ncbi:MAG: hypothetical protein ACHQ49_16360 [Elusimicrobiota bacterium]